MSRSLSSITVLIQCTLLSMLVACGGLPTGIGTTPVGIPDMPSQTITTSPTSTKVDHLDDYTVTPSDIPSMTPGISIPGTPEATKALSTIPGTTTQPPLLSEPNPVRTLYNLQVVLNYASHTLDVEQRIEYTNTTPERLVALPLVVEARRYPNAFQLKSVFDNQGERFSDFQWKETLLTLSMQDGLEPGENTLFTLSYTLRLPNLDTLANTRPHPLGYNSQQVNSGDWYPLVPPYQLGQGWLVHPPAMYGEHLVYDIADFEVAIRHTNAPPGMVIAASSPGSLDGEWLRFRHTAARSFAWSASPYYQVAGETVQLAGNKKVEISSYYFPFHEEAGKAVLQGMSQALILYSSLFGTYPHPALAGVQAGFMDGMEYDGLFFLSTDFYNWFKNPPEDFLVALVAHEVSHQWWSGLVSSDQALQPWLDEALCTYSERIFYEHLFPEALDWWWEYRVNYYQPAGWIDISVYDVPQEYGYYRKYRDPVYLRGALFLEELRALIGDLAFISVLRQYAAHYAYQQATAEAFMSILQQNSPVGLEPLFSRYFKNPG